MASERVNELLEWWERASFTPNSPLADMPPETHRKLLALAKLGAAAIRVREAELVLEDDPNEWEAFEKAAAAYTAARENLEAEHGE